MHTNGTLRDSGEVQHYALLVLWWCSQISKCGRIPVACLARRLLGSDAPGRDVAMVTCVTKQLIPTKMHIVSAVVQSSLCSCCVDEALSSGSKDTAWKPDEYVKQAAGLHELLRACRAASWKWKAQGSTNKAEQLPAARYIFRLSFWAWTLTSSLVTACLACQLLGQEQAH